MKDLSDYLQRAIELHGMLNAPRCPMDIDDRYEKLRRDHADLLTASRLLLQWDDSLVSLHDAWVENLAERRLINDYLTHFTARAFVYKDGMEAGTMPIRMAIASRKSLFEIKEREIYDWLVDPHHRLLGVLYHQPGHGLKSVQVEYLSMSHAFGDIAPY